MGAACTWPASQCMAVRQVHVATDHRRVLRTIFCSARGCSAPVVIRGDELTVVCVVNRCVYFRKLGTTYYYFNAKLMYKILRVSCCHVASHWQCMLNNYTTDATNHKILLDCSRICACLAPGRRIQPSSRKTR